ncbi:MAG: tRNA-dihydrouridine synthase family protein, partial [Deltaproteobacteria bacterium]|nr:tRNA-dihydrouridine synthase family protein [Deltaproteobacteria bacterium]
MSIRGFTLGNLRLDNPLVLAPLSGVTNLPFRLLAKRHGAALVVTEMISGAGLCQGSVKTVRLMDSEPEERPLVVQLFGARPGWLARAAELVQEAGADVIDINMGCPVRKVVRHGAGAALLKDFNLIKDILTQVRRVVTIPLTVKTRIGWKPGVGEIDDLAPILADCGVDGVTLHGRWAIQKYSGKADWSKIARLVE